MRKPEPTIEEYSEFHSVFQSLSPAEVQEHFEKKAVRLILQRYKKFYGTPWVEVQHVDSFERLSALPYMCQTGGHKQISKINLGALLNSFHKSELASRFKTFSTSTRDSEDYLYIFSIPTSTALYALVPGEIFHPSLCTQMRFLTYITHNNELVTIVRLDDYLDWKWPVE